MSPVQEKKAKLRKKLILVRDGMQKTVIDKKSALIFKNFLKIGKNRYYGNVLLYIPINNEVDTDLLFNYFKTAKSNIFLPTFSKTKNKWGIGRFEGMINLEKGPFNTRQPKDAEITDCSAIDLVIVPGVAFSEGHARLGYGKGVYDDLLHSSRALKIGLAYDFQINNKWDHERHDTLMDYVVTNKIIYK